MKLKSFFKHPKIIIGVCLGLTIFFACFINGLSIQNSIREWLPETNESRMRLEQTEQDFGSMIIIGVSLKTQRGSFLTKENIETVRQISERALSIPEVSDVISLTNIDFVQDVNGTISATNLIPEEYTGTKEDIKKIKNSLLEWEEMYDKVLLNDKGNATQMQIILHAPTKEEKKAMSITETQRQQTVLNEVRQIVHEEISGKNLSCEIFGDPVISENSKAFMLSDLMRLIPLVVVVILISLFLSFKTLDGTILPLITVALSTIWTVAIMSLLNIQFNIISSVIPVALIAVGSAYGIHVLTHYYIGLDTIDGEITKEKYFDAIFKSLKEVFPAVLLAGLTTIVGFISCITSPIQPLHSFAAFTSVGVAISLLLSVTLIPALLMCKNIKKVQTKSSKMVKLTKKVKAKLERAKKLAGGKEGSEASGNTLYSIYHFFCGSKPRLFTFIAIIIVFSGIGLKKLHIDTSLVNYFPKDCTMRKEIDDIDREFAGTNSLYILIEGNEKGSITEPEILKAADEMQENLQEKFPEIGKIASLTSFVKRINQVWHVPQEKNIVNTESVSLQDDFSGFDDFENFSEFADFSEFTDFSESEPSQTEQTLENWVDPNISYLQNLSMNQTVKEVIDMLQDSYVECGGKNATPEKMLKFIEKKYNYNGMAYYEIPEDVEKYPVVSKEELKGVITGYLTLLSGSLDRFCDDDLNPSVMRIQCQLKTRSTEKTKEIIDFCNDYAEKNFPKGYQLKFTGAAEMEYTMTKLIVKSQITSLLISIISVFIILSISFKSCFAGIIGAIPLALTILLNYMTMGFSQINLDLVTSIIASLAVGVGIDYTIHFLSTYKEEREKSDDLEKVTRETFKKSGHAILTNAIAVGFGFLVLCFSKFIVLRYIGILVAIVMFTSSILSMTVIPGILNQFQPKFMQSEEEKKELK